jgi:hypothetical protein
LAVGRQHGNAVVLAVLWPAGLRSGG